MVNNSKLFQVGQRAQGVLPSAEEETGGAGTSKLHYLSLSRKRAEGRGQGKLSGRESMAGRRSVTQQASI